jgi:uncharacterized protein YcbK (DUF882 family)
MLSEHFSREEFACHHCGQLPVDGISKELLEGLETLRKAVGRPIHVTNGYRCPEHNEAVGGVYNSQHVQGCAADIWVDGIGVFELYSIAVEIFDAVGIYLEGGFIHVDMRSDGKEIGEYVWFE